ncbi:MAG: S-layer homology domain-containing protein, partial [Clostridia bacterium]|nr:S-layer homology domain-containing protein [Clostridia bacterium]
TGAVKWAAQNGVVKGMGAGKFAPNAKIDRQQMCVMLVNYVENYTKSSLYQYKAYMGFADENKIAGWAQSSVEKCYRANLVKGTTGGKFSPLSVATRKEGATVFTNFHKEYIA